MKSSTWEQRSLRSLKLGRNTRIYLIRCEPFKGIVGAFLVVELEIISDPSSGLSHTLVGFQIDFLVFQAAPHPFDKDIVDPSALAVHADSDIRILEDIDEGLAGELGALVRIEDLGGAITTEGGKGVRSCI